MLKYKSYIDIDTLINFFINWKTDEFHFCGKMSQPIPYFEYFLLSETSHLNEIVPVRLLTLFKVFPGNLLNTIHSSHCILDLCLSAYILFVHVNTVETLVKIHFFLGTLSLPFIEKVS